MRGVAWCGVAWARGCERVACGMCSEVGRQAGRQIGTLKMSPGCSRRSAYEIHTCSRCVREGKEGRKDGGVSRGVIEQASSEI